MLKRNATGKTGGQFENKNALQHGLWGTRTANYKEVALDLRKEIAYLGGVVEKLSLKIDAMLASNKLMTTKERENLFASPRKTTEAQQTPTS